MSFNTYLNQIASSFSTGEAVEKVPVPMTVMILSPHPDDESIIGSLPFRLMHENGAHVINVAVTLGSDKKRKKERLQELTEACALLDVELVTLHEDWKRKAVELKSLIQKYQPQVILAPHLKDHHPTHIKTGQLLTKALKTLVKMNVLVVWTEFWGHNPTPNVLVEVPTDIVDLQMRALECHRGEIARNPYHLRLPAWMMDNVRRGAEIIDGKGAASPDFAFGVLYKWEFYKNGKKKKLDLPVNTLNRLCDIGSLIESVII